ncbi:nuclear transport factor 2 family protein [Photobacterium sp. TY1-4]|uniref:nuclear transport factor 2 family protein n=1 Tax=Photobacterium sp. TY1-4 TaxID=2899122 RepID=UPI0021C0E421|nr:nuclear transport factor 2 family protein [Photobacterium sp. TY1-4]UXI04062.1 nuclear transport factor 2 family protein [Photobacterium sp. TY1-4]
MAKPDPVIHQFVEVYSQLSKDHLSVLENLYHPDVIFEDPAHQVIGWDNLQAYFTRLFKTVSECRFEIHDTVADGQKAYVEWEMIFSHPRLSGGATRKVHGCSRLEIQEHRIIRHRDYFDLGEMLYEGVPVLGAVVRQLKARL